MLSKFTVEAIPKEQTHEWLLKKHYAKRIPPILYSFGLYDSNTLVGICTFGTPCRAYNNGEFVFHNYQVKTFELNRLCTNSDLPRNANSFFVARAQSNCSLRRAALLAMLTITKVITDLYIKPAILSTRD